METVKKKEFGPEYRAPQTKVIELDTYNSFLQNGPSGGETGTVVPGQEGGFDD